jgi:hypothetical protein
MTTLLRLRSFEGLFPNSDWWSRGTRYSSPDLELRVIPFGPVKDLDRCKLHEPCQESWLSYVVRVCDLARWLHF